MVLDVSAGQESATDKESGQLYKLTWAQDADGALSVDKWEAIDGEPSQ